jgi:restriction system protein
MAIPDFQKIMLPLLEFLGDKQEHSLRETIDSLADQFDLSEEERRELLPSAQQAIFANRVGWARTHIKGDVGSKTTCEPRNRYNMVQYNMILFT